MFPNGQEQVETCWHSLHAAAAGREISLSIAALGCCHRAPTGLAHHRPLTDIVFSSIWTTSYTLPISFTVMGEASFVPDNPTHITGSTGFYGLPVAGKPDLTQNLQNNPINSVHSFIFKFNFIKLFGNNGLVMSIK